MLTPRFTPLDQLDDFELVSPGKDPSRFSVIGAGDFVLGSVSRLIVDTELQEVAYLVVDTRLSNFTEGRGEQRLLPLGWCEIQPSRRQVRLPQLAWYAFRCLPIYAVEGPLPEAIGFPSPYADDPALLDIA